VSTGGTSLAAGPAIARTIVLAAELAAVTARVAGRADLARRARDLAAQAAPLGPQDASAYQDFLRTRSDEARQRTIDLPLRMAELAAETAELAADAAAIAEGAVGGDAMVGTLLAETSARAAALLVRVNGGGEAAADATDRAARAAARLSLV
jgi:formiminotetrahydrofolate cyclodeaminase